jgi:hypothetical protein
MMDTMHTTPTHPQRKDDHLEPHQPAQLPAGINKNSSKNGDLIGKPPTTFDGDRSKADRFATQLGLFMTINERNPVITNPVRRVALALSYIRGPKVDDWVSQQFYALMTKAFGDDDHAPTHAYSDEALWDDFVTEIERAYSQMGEEVLARLKNLRLTGDDVEMYISTFENLARQVGCEREDRLMVDYFRQGLPADLKRSIMKRDTIPNTIDEWQSATRKEVDRRILANIYSPGPKGDTDAVQTGFIRLSRLSEEERARLMTEDRCFECNGKGYRARDCPDQLKGEHVRN